MKNILIISLILLTGFVVSGTAVSQQIIDPMMEEDNTNQIRYQIRLYSDATEYLDDIFREFNGGYINPDEALKRVNLMKHEYNKLVAPVPPEGQKLHELVNKLFSQVENYFIYFKRVYRENPEINLNVLKTKYYAAQEASRLEYSNL